VRVVSSVRGFPRVDGTRDARRAGSFALASLEGIEFDFRTANLHAGGVFLGAFDLGNGLRVRVGSAIATCS
jgi:hypothetical protein